MVLRLVVFSLIASLPACFLPDYNDLAGIGEGEGEGEG